MKLSASSIQSWLNCRRLYAANKISKIPIPQTPGRHRGSELHRAFEDLVQLGKTPSLNDNAIITTHKAAIEKTLEPFTQYPNASVIVEEAFEWAPWPLVTDTSIRGFKDLVVRSPALGVIVFDHKFTKNIKYAMSATELRDDIQAQIYAADEFRRDLTVDTVRLQWTYSATQGPPKTSTIQIQITRRESTEFLEGFLLPCIGLIEYDMREVRDWKDAPPDLSHCRKYGGCSLLPTCLTPEQRLKTSFHQR